MANVPPPPKSGSRLQAAPPPPAEAPVNMSTPNGDRTVDLNFKVSPALHQAFKMEAAARGMTMKEILEASFRCYLERYPRPENVGLF